MRAWHAVLLAVGAALAGAAAFKLTAPQPPPPESEWRAAPDPGPSPAAAEAPQAIPQTRRVPRDRAANAPPAVFTETEAQPQPHPQTAPKTITIKKTKPSPFDEPVARNPPVKPFPSAVYVPDPVDSKPLTPAPAPVFAPKPTPTVSQNPARPRRHVTLEPGMTLAVRINGSLPGCSVPNETFTGALVEPLVVDHLIIAERGARVSGRCSAHPNQTELVLSRVMTADGQWLAISTAAWRPGADGVIPTRFEISAPVTITERDLSKQYLSKQ